MIRVIRTSDVNRRQSPKLGCDQRRVSIQHMCLKGLELCSVTSDYVRGWEVLGARGCCEIGWQCEIAGSEREGGLRRNLLWYLAV